MKSCLARALALVIGSALLVGCSGEMGAPAPFGGAPTMASTARQGMLASEQRAPGYDFVAGADGTLRSRAGRFGAVAEVASTGRGVRLSHGFELGVATESVGRDGAPRSRGVLAQHAEGQELVLEREDDVEERFLSGPLGVEQSYLVRAKPAGRGPLVIEVAFEGLLPEAVSGAADRLVLRDGEGMVRGGYRGLVATDADGHELAARMQVRGRAVALVVEDGAAASPVRVDPLVWFEQSKLIPGDGAANDYFGGAVVLSGGTAVVGASGHGQAYGQGAVYVFAQSGTDWIQKAEVVAADGAGDDFFGAAVALSGNTLAVGAYGHNSGRGAAYIWVQSGTSWTQQAELTASDGADGDYFGEAVDLNGDTAIVGAPRHNSMQGSAYVFSRSGTSWTQQAELAASDGSADAEFGAPAVLSGATAFIGGDFYGPGAAYVFASTGTTWSQHAKLTASDGGAHEYFAGSLAVSGSTAIFGAFAHPVGTNAAQGAAYVFVNSGTTWSQQAELTASDGAESDSFGYDVALSGSTAVVSASSGHKGGTLAPGAAYVFVQSGQSWAQQAEVTASDGVVGDEFGTLALSGGTFVVGASGTPRARAPRTSSCRPCGQCVRAG